MPTKCAVSEASSPPVRWKALDTDSLSTYKIIILMCIVVMHVHVDQLTCTARSTLILEKELREMCSNFILGIIQTP